LEGVRPLLFGEMMKKRRIAIKSLPFSGRYGSTYRAHSVVVADADEARELVEAGHASYIDGEAEIEVADAVHREPAAVIETAEAAPVRRPSARGRARKKDK
jgi:hypothetical protein